MNGTSVENTRLTVKISDDNSSGFMGLNFFGVGGAGNENQINFHSYAGRPGGPSS